MKAVIRNVFLAVAVLSSSAHAIQANGPMFGYVAAEIPPAGGVNLVGYGFNPGDPQVIEDVFSISALTKSTDPALADLVYVWNDASSSFKACFQKPDGFFYLRDTPASRANVSIQNGTALFLKSPASASSSKRVRLYGAVPLSDTEARPFGKWTVIANPYPTELDLNTVDWSRATAGDLPTLADQIHIWSPTKAGGPGYVSYFLKNIGGTNAWCSGIAPFGTVDPVIPIGGGAVYQAISPFTNSIVRPFSL